MAKILTCMLLLLIVPCARAMKKSDIGSLALTGHTYWVKSANFNRAGDQVVTASEDRTARIWDATTGQVIHALNGHTYWVKSANFNRAGTQVITASTDHTALIWDASTGKVIHVLNGHTYFVNSANFNRAGTQVVTASDDHTARIWDASTGQVIHVLNGHTGLVNFANFNKADTQIITLSSDGTARIWNALKGQVIQVLDGHTNLVKFLIYFVCCGGLSGKFGSANFNREGTHVVTSFGDRDVRVWDTITGQLIHVLKHTGRVISANFNRAGTQVVTVSFGGTACIWKDINIGKRILALAMGLHERCGQKSPISQLSPYIIRDNIVQRMRALNTFDAMVGNSQQNDDGQYGQNILSRISKNRIVKIVGIICSGAITVASIAFIVAKYVRR